MAALSLEERVTALETRLEQIVHIHPTHAWPGIYRHEAANMMRSFLEPDNLIVFAG